MSVDRVARVDRSLALVLTGAGEVAARVPRSLEVVTGDHVEAVTGGRLPARRLSGYLKLRRELDHQEGRRSEHEIRAAGRRASRMYREVQRAKGRRR